MEFKTIIKKVSLLLSVLLFFNFFPGIVLASGGVFPASNGPAYQGNILKDKVIAEIVLKSGSKSARLNGRPVTLDSAVTTGAQPLVTGKFLAESLKAAYSYSPSSKMADFKALSGKSMYFA